MPPTHATTVDGVGAHVEERVGAAQQEDAGGDHGGRVDERRHRRRAFHRVGQPEVQRDLRALARPRRASSSNAIAVAVPSEMARAPGVIAV